MKIVVIGQAESGKSHFAKALAKAMHLTMANTSDWLSEGAKLSVLMQKSQWSLINIRIVNG
jgi:adenylate kinase family enzyme